MNKTDSLEIARSRHSLVIIKKGLGKLEVMCACMKRMFLPTKTGRSEGTTSVLSRVNGMK